MKKYHMIIISRYGLMIITRPVNNEHSTSHRAAAHL
jgi:hypothetical protein